jgi:hypothetical protein
MKTHALFFAFALSLSTLPQVLAAGQGSPASGPAAVPSAEPTVEELIAKLDGLQSNVYGRTLAEVIRDLKNPEQQRAACIYIRALAHGDVAAFLGLVPEKGLLLDNQQTKKKEKLSRAEVGKRAALTDEHKRPVFLGVLNEVASEDPKILNWNVDVRKGRLTVSANGAFAWATLSKGAGDRYFIEKITISFNND